MWSNYFSLKSSILLGFRAFLWVCGQKKRVTTT
nr:MAG TPA_asm: hypothetical protein [Caudoviricetes sp.]